MHSVCLSKGIVNLTKWFPLDRYALPGLIVLVALFACVYRLAVYPPPWFDEGFSTDLALTLIEQGVYGTRSADGVLPFDSEVTSGPPVTLLVALSFLAFGVDNFQARLALIPYALVALLAVYRLSARLYGRWAALLTLLVWLAVPPLAEVSFLLLSRQVLGEGPALAYLLLGLWLWLESWRGRRPSRVWLAGLCFGLAVVAKMYLGLTVLPALGVVALLRSLHLPGQWLTAWAPIVTSSGLVIAWLAVSFIGTPAELRHADEASLSDHIEVLLLSGLSGRNLGNSGLVMVVIALAASVTAGWRLTRPGISWDERSVAWVELALLLIAVFSLAWFAFLSIGWPRYFYVGWMVSMIFLARWLWGTGLMVARRWPRTKPLLVMAAPLSLALSLSGVHFEPASRQPESGARETTAFVRQHIPREAVIFTWEWELRAPSRHRNFRAPPTGALTLAIQQRFLEHRPFDVQHDLLAANPDFVIRGAMSDWVGLYDEAVLLEHFVEVFSAGRYRLYQRR